jgi:hypothetical protein
MKAFFSAIALGIVVVIANVLSYAAIMNGPSQLKSLLEAPKEVQHLRVQLELSRQSEQILRDELADYNNQLAALRAARTYEEGVQDGIRNSANITYMQGYHAATHDANAFNGVVNTEND